jgi:hypothetical protein
MGIKRLLRHVFLGPPADRADAFHADDLEGWLDALTPDNPAATARALLAQVQRMRGEGLRPAARLEMLELLRDKAEATIASVEEQLRRVAVPLPPAQLQACSASQDLLGELGASYLAVAEAARSGARRGGAPHLQAAVSAGLELALRSQRLAYRVYAPAPDWAWLQMHRLYAIAQERGFARLQAQGQEATPEEVYLRSLLLAFAQPAKFAPGDLDQVRFYVDRYAHLASLDPVELGARSRNDKSRFLVRPGKARPGWPLRRRGEVTPRRGDLVLVCGPLVQNLQTQLDGLKKRTSPARLGLPRSADRPQYFLMLRSLAALWGTPPSRRFPRALFHPRVEMVAGFDALWSFIGQAAFQRRSDDPKSSAAHLPAATTWAVLNESADGFALRHLGGGTSDLQVGEIAAIRPRDAAALHVTAVRRASVISARLELGVQVISSQPNTAMIALPVAEPGEPKRQRLARAIFLPKLPGSGGVPGLLVKSEGTSVGSEFAAPYQGRMTLMRVAGIAERYASCDLYLLEPIGASARDEEMPQAASRAHSVST